MKKNFKTIVAIMATTIAVSACSDFDGFLSGDASSEKGKVPTDGTLVATTFGSEGEGMVDAISSRTKIGTDGKQVFWQTSDEISVFDTQLSNRKFTLKTGSGTKTGTFEGEAIAAASKFYAIYPYNDGYSYTDKEGVVSGVTVSETADASITTTDRNYSSKVMMGATTAAEKNFAFKNITARLDLNITNANGSPIAVTISANGGETLAGTGTLDWNNGDPIFTDFEETFPYVNLGNFSNTSNNRMYVIPGTLESGFTVCVKTLGANAHTYYFHSNNSVKFERNKIYTFTLDCNNANGIGSVDLGLPSGNLFDAMNLGATNPLETGDFYAYGETETKETYTWANYKWCDGAAKYNEGETGHLTKYVLAKNKHNAKNGIADGRNVLENKDDVAYQQTNGAKRMPNRPEAQEFVDNVTFELLNIGGVKCIKYISKINGKSIISPLVGGYNATYAPPAASCLWGSSQSTSDGTSQGGSSCWITYGAYMSDNVTQMKLVARGRSSAYAVRAITPKDKHEYVDMGEAGKWATTNIGASIPSQFGEYYAWGETQTKETYTSDTYKASLNTKYASVLSVMTDEDDAATAAWGTDWRIPTKAEFDKLISVCNWTQATESTVEYNYVSGYVGTHKTNGNKIFFPCAGNWSGTSIIYWSASSAGEAHQFGAYWTRNIWSQYVGRGTVFGFYPGQAPVTSNSTGNPIAGYDRVVGLPIRAIHK